MIKIVTFFLNYTFNNEQYFNVYFIDPMFKTEPLNNLREQIPIENEPKDWKKYLTCQYIEYYA